MTAGLLLASMLLSQNTLSAREREDGWRLLFDGQTTTGWHNFRKDTVGSGWQIRDGVLEIVNPESAGDLVSDEEFSWFDLKVDVRIGEGQNSGIMFHVQESKGEYPWQSGPEVQIYDHKFEAGVETTGFLYQLYTAKHDASRPAGEWNTIEIHIAPDTCWTKVNGQTYYTFKLGSKDFWARVQKSKFHEYPFFAAKQSGRLAIQGDHGKVAFRNIKIRKWSPQAQAPFGDLRP